MPVGSGVQTDATTRNMQCIEKRIQPISLCKPCVMSIASKNVGRAVQRDPTLLH